MPVSFNVNSQQKEVIEFALKGKKILEVKSNARTIELTSDNVIPFKEAIQSFYDKKFSVKSKNVMHLEACFLAQELLNRVNHIISLEFPNINEPANDSDIGVVIDNPLGIEPLELTDYVSEEEINEIHDEIQKEIEEDNSDD
jgi:hypothetical protein